MFVQLYCSFNVLVLAHISLKLYNILWMIVHLIYGKGYEQMKKKRIRVKASIKPKLTVGEWLENWLENYARPSVRVSTFDIYQAYVHNHLIPCLGQKTLEKLTATDIQIFLRYLQTEGNRKEANKGLSPSTVINIRNLLKAALEQAVVEGKIPINPARQTRPPKSERPPMNILNPAELALFLQGSIDSPYYAAYVLAITTGMRRGEILGLTWDAVDLGFSWNDIDNLKEKLSALRLWDTESMLFTLKQYKLYLNNPPRVTISQQLSDLRGGPKLTLPKTRRSQRSICIPTDTALILIFHRTIYQNCSSDFIFSGKKGKPLNPRSFTCHFQWDLRRTGVKRIRFHDLRHTVATLLLEDGKAINTVQELLGHYTAAFTAAQYGHVTKKMHLEATDTLANTLKQAREQLVHSAY